MRPGGFLSWCGPSTDHGAVGISKDSTEIGMDPRTEGGHGGLADGTGRMIMGGQELDLEAKG